MKRAESGIITGHSDINGRPGEKAIIGGKVWRVGGGEIIMSEKAATDNCAELSRMNVEAGGKAFDCDEQKAANVDRASGAMPKDEYHREAAAGGTKAVGGTLIGSAGSQESLEKLINAYFYSTTYRIEDGKLYSNKGLFERGRIEQKKGRWRFVMNEAATGLKINKKPTKNEINNIIAGTRPVNFGESILYALGYLRRNASASKMAGRTKFEEQEIIANYKSPISVGDLPAVGEGGREHLVYRFDGKHLIKCNNCYFYDSWEDYLTNLLLHNYIFPATAYELMGFTTKLDRFRSVVRQRYIEPTEANDMEFVKEWLNNNGFKSTKEGDYINSEIGISVEDLHDKNIITENGLIYFIDTVFAYQSAASGSQTPSTMTKESFDTIASDKTLTKKERMIRLHRAGASRKEIKKLAKANAGEVSNAIKAAGKTTPKDVELKVRTDRAMRLWEKELSATTGASIPQESPQDKLARLRSDLIALQVRGDGNTNQAKVLKRQIELLDGAKHELEHAKTIETIKNNPDISTEKAAAMIAKDHLAEDPNYYKKLNKMENAAAGGAIWPNERIFKNAHDGTPYKVIGDVTHKGDVGIDFGESPGSLPLIRFPESGSGYFHPSDLLKTSHQNFFESWGMDEEDVEDFDDASKGKKTERIKNYRLSIVRNSDGMTKFPIYSATSIGDAKLNAQQDFHLDEWAITQCEQIDASEYSNAPGTDADSSAASGTQPQKTTPMNLYYLKIGNKIHESHGGQLSYKYEILGFKRTPEIAVPHGMVGGHMVAIVKEYSVTPGRPTPSFEIKLALIQINMDDKHYTIEGCTYETDRDKVLLQTEIASIENDEQSRELATMLSDAKTKAAQAEMEVATATTEAEKQKGAFGDTIKGMEALAGGWQSKRGALLPPNAEAFLAKFPDNATSWAKATDEVRDIARTAKEYYNGITLDVLEEDPKAMQPWDFRRLKTPSEWNTKGKKYIRTAYGMMNAQAREQFLERFKDWFTEKAAGGNSEKNHTFTKEDGFTKSGVYLIRIADGEPEIMEGPFDSVSEAGRYRDDFDKSGLGSNDVERIKAYPVSASGELKYRSAAGGKVAGKDKGIPNNYKQKTGRDVWNSWTTEQKDHFLKDHRPELSSEGRKSFTYRDYEQLPEKTQIRVDEHVTDGQYASGKGPHSESANIIAKDIIDNLKEYKHIQNATIVRVAKSHKIKTTPEIIEDVKTILEIEGKSVSSAAAGKLTKAEMRGVKSAEAWNKYKETGDKKYLNKSNRLARKPVKKSKSNKK